MLYIDANRDDRRFEMNWWIGSQYFNLNNVEVVEIQADGDELQFIYRAFPEMAREGRVVTFNQEESNKIYERLLKARVLSLLDMENALVSAFFGTTHLDENTLRNLAKDMVEVYTNDGRTSNVG